MKLLLSPLTRIIVTKGIYVGAHGTITKTVQKGNGFYCVTLDDGTYVVGLTNDEVRV